MGGRKDSAKFQKKLTPVLSINFGANDSYEFISICMGTRDDIS